MILKLGERSGDLPEITQISLKAPIPTQGHLIPVLFLEAKLSNRHTQSAHRAGGAGARHPASRRLRSPISKMRRVEEVIPGVLSAGLPSAYKSFFFPLNLPPLGTWLIPISPHLCPIVASLLVEPFTYVLP